MQAGLAILLELEKPGLYEDLERKTNILMTPIRQAGIKVNRVGSMFTVFVEEEKYNELFIYLFEKEIYSPPSQHETCFISSARTEEHLEETKSALMQFLL